MSFSTKASSNYVIVGGNAIGLDINTGVYVTGKSNKNSNLIKGDTIVSIDKKIINSVDELKEVVSKKEIGSLADIVFIRDGLEMKTSIPVNDKNGEKSLGLYVKDNILGVGTLTFINPETKVFAALGHSACSDLIELKSGNIVNCYIKGIKKAVEGIPGEKKATLDNLAIGEIGFNNDYGLYGTLNENYDFKKSELVEIATISEVTLGKATIRTVLEDDKIEEFDIEIVELLKQEKRDIKGIKYKIIDEDLIERTGGVIQGMSGSPIIQNNKLIGAVSHVVVNDPLVGYGVYAQWMYDFIG